MAERFGFLLKCRVLLAVAIVLMLFSNSYAAGEPAEFKHQYLSLTLPAGWSVKGDAVTGKELIGWLQSKSKSHGAQAIFPFRFFTTSTSFLSASVDKPKPGNSFLRSSNEP